VEQVEQFFLSFCTTYEIRANFVPPVCSTFGFFGGTGGTLFIFHVIVCYKTK